MSALQARDGARGRKTTTRPTLALIGATVLLAYSGGGQTAGDPERGKALYAVCATCHGPNGEGMREMNAPALAGREDWYLVRQIENFKTGVRGRDPNDVYGLQMAPMAQVLADDQAIEDVAAYLSSLDD